MDNDQLVALREKILQDIVPLVLDNAQNGADRFDLLLRIIQAGNASGELYSRAYESAKSIEGGDDRLEALLSLLDEIDLDVNQNAQTPEANQDQEVAPPQESTGENFNQGL